MKLDYINGRYGSGPLKPENMEATVKETEDGIEIRLDDSAHPEMWLEIRLVREKVKKVAGGEDVHHS